MIELVLFDVDGTLLDCHDCHVQAFAQVFKTVFGINGQLSDVDFPGMLTPNTLIEVCAQHECIVAPDDVRLQHAMSALEDAMLTCVGQMWGAPQVKWHRSKHLVKNQSPGYNKSQLIVGIKAR